MTYLSRLAIWAAQESLLRVTDIVMMNESPRVARISETSATRLTRSASEPPLSLTEVNPEVLSPSQIVLAADPGVSCTDHPDTTRSFQLVSDASG